MWFRKNAITNIIAPKNLIKEYGVTYDRIDQIFVVHREDQVKPKIESRIHESVLRCHNPNDKLLVLINTVSRNKQLFARSQISSTEQSKSLYAILSYPPVKYLCGLSKDRKL